MRHIFLGLTRNYQPLADSHQDWVLFERFKRFEPFKSFKPFKSFNPFKPSLPMTLFSFDSLTISCYERRKILWWNG